MCGSHVEGRFEVESTLRFWRLEPAGGREGAQTLIFTMCSHLCYYYVLLFWLIIILLQMAMTILYPAGYNYVYRHCIAGDTLTTVCVYLLLFVLVLTVLLRSSPINQHLSRGNQ
jgi:hypothetical protein